MRLYGLHACLPVARVRVAVARVGHEVAVDCFTALVQDKLLIARYSTDTMYQLLELVVGSQSNDVDANVVPVHVDRDDCPKRLGPAVELVEQILGTYRPLW